MASAPVQPLRGLLRLLVLLGVVLPIAACATTRQTRSTPEPVGFLADYSELKPGKDGEAQLLYINPDARWSGYNRVMIDSVTLWSDAETTDVSPEDAQSLTDYLYKNLHEQLGKDYEIVDEPGPGVMRVRAAITEAKGARVVGNAVTTIVPQLRLLSNVAGMASGTQVFVGRAAVEGDITDSLTGRRLAAFVDERAGGKTIRGGLKTWSDADRAFEYWAERLRKRLEELRASS